MERDYLQNKHGDKLACFTQYYIKTRIFYVHKSFGLIDFTKKKKLTAMSSSRSVVVNQFVSTIYRTE